MRWISNFKTLVSAYCKWWWIPPLGVVCAFMAKFLEEFIHSQYLLGVVHYRSLAEHTHIISDIAVAVSLLGYLAAVVVHLCTKKWEKGLGLLLLSVIMVPGIYMFYFLGLMHCCSQEDFGKDIVIPADMKVEDVPEENYFKPSGLREISIIAGYESKRRPVFYDNNTDILVTRAYEGGRYNVYAHVNPGEPGSAYIKVFEATRNTPLSEYGTKRDSEKKMGWSGNKDSRYYYKSHIVVYEGDWGVYYPARFELWFIPDSGGPERKLVEKIFKIEGWQR